MGGEGICLLQKCDLVSLTAWILIRVLYFICEFTFYIQNIFSLAGTVEDRDNFYYMSEIKLIDRSKINKLQQET